MTVWPIVGAAGVKVKAALSGGALRVTPVWSGPALATGVWLPAEALPEAKTAGAAEGVAEGVGVGSCVGDGVAVGVGEGA